MYSFWHKTDWAKFWAIFSQSHLVTLVETTLNRNWLRIEPTQEPVYTNKKLVAFIRATG
jgi:hypothetical protein